VDKSRGGGSGPVHKASTQERSGDPGSGCRNPRAPLVDPATDVHLGAAPPVAGPWRKRGVDIRDRLTFERLQAETGEH